METSSLIYQLHTPEQLVLFSNIGHWVEGGLFLLVAIFSALNVFYGKNKSWLAYVWPWLIVVSGVFLVIFSYAHHYNELGLAWKAAWQDMQQRQHFYMTILITIAGIGELVALKRGQAMSVSRFFLPASLSIIGMLFLTHPQHGTSEAVRQAKVIHDYLGATLVLSGVLRAIAMLTPKPNRVLALAWVFFLTVASILLIAYREPEGAYMHSTTNETHTIDIPNEHHK